MTDNVVNIAGPATNPDTVLKEAIGEFKSVLIIGYNHDDLIEARASLNLDRKEILWLMEYFKHDQLMLMDEE